MPDESGLTYQLNARDEIVSVCARWNAFATANDAAHVQDRHVLQRPIWDFVSDDTTRLLYQRVLQRARAGRPAQFGFRCDAPTHRRLMTMTVSLVGHGVLECRTETVLDESRPPVRLLDPNADRANGLVRMCGWCNRVSVGNIWAEVEDAIGQLRILEQSPLPRLTHGICSECYDAVLATIA